MLYFPKGMIFDEKGNFRIFGGAYARFVCIARIRSLDFTGHGRTQ